MLYQTESGFIDVVIEPQYRDFQFGSPLCSVISSDLGSLMRLRNSVRGEIDFRPHDNLFPFTGFAYLDDLARDLKMRSVLENVDYVSQNFSRPPIAYDYLGFEETDEHGIEGDTWQGSIWPSEVHDFRYSVDASFEYFRVWPLFYLPTTLSGIPTDMKTDTGED